MRNLIAVVLFFSAPLLAAEIHPGNYNSGSENSLQIKARTDGDFDVEGTATNEKIQVCELKGRLTKATGIFQMEGTEKDPCRMSILPSGARLEITYMSGCQSYCPDALSFEGTYQTDNPECERSLVAKRRSEGRKLFDRKEYPKARDHFAAIEKGCGVVMSSEDRGWLANDLALSQHKLGDDEACRKSLQVNQPLVDTFAINKGLDGLGYDKNLKKALEKLAKATQVNLRLCASHK